jgi:hypothetical protein
MPISPDIVGSTFPAQPPYQVTAERVGAFAEATGSIPGAVPATFPIVVAFGAMNALLADPSVGISLHRVVHGEQRFSYTRPVLVGDVLVGQLTVESLRQIGGADIIGTRTDITDGSGSPVVSAFATLVHRGEGA